MDKARLLVADAMAKPILDSMVFNLHGKVELLETQTVSIRTSYSELLRVEKEKNRELSGKSGDLEKIISLQADQIKHEKKRTRAVKWQRNGLGILLAVVIGLTITH
jgi:hypothetical protein